LISFVSSARRLYSARLSCRWRCADTSRARKSSSNSSSSFD
jgi:hypothetical protein